MGGTGGMWDISVPSSQFSCEPTTGQNEKYFLKRFRKNIELKRGFQLKETGYAWEVRKRKVYCGIIIITASA